LKGGDEQLISFDDFLMEAGIPIYLQIILWLKRGIASGQIRDGDEVPSRRMLSARLGVNPNTVQKAYRLLEEEGLLVSQSGAKSLMSLTEEKCAAVRESLLRSDVRSLVGALARLGLTKGEVLDLVEQYWEEANEA
jgi:GntR family transcriptional regulator